MKEQPPLPPGWAVEKGRHLWHLLYEGKIRSSGGTEDAVRDAIHLQRELHDGPVAVIDPGQAVDL